MTSIELIWGAALSAGGLLIAATKWFIQRFIRQADKRLDDYEDRIAAVEMDYVSKETLRLAVGEIKSTIDAWGSDMHRGIDTAHTRLDTVYNELLRRSGT